MDSDGPRRLIMHAGTPKTGTTTLQIAMGNQSEALARRGVLIPRAGRGTEPQVGAHQALAHAFIAPDAGDENPDGVNALLAELSASALPNAIVSSENFCWLYHVPAKQREIVEALSSIGYIATIVLYVRDQCGYAESVYAEFVKHGFAWDVDSYVDAVAGSGAEPPWRFSFDYARLADGFAAHFGATNVMVRPYRATAPSNDLLRDFSDAAGLTTDGKPLLENEPSRHNPRLTFLDVLNRIRVNAANKPADAPGVTELFGAVGLRESDFADVPFGMLDGSDVVRIRETFAAPNRALFERYGTEVPQEFASVTSGERAEKRLLQCAAKRWALGRV